MVSKRMIGFLLAMLVGASQAHAHLIVDYRGHLWEQSDSTQSLVTAVGLVQSLVSPLTADPAVYEYTWTMEGLVPSVPLSSMTSPGSVTFSGGRFSIYEDMSWNADFGVNPPNPTSPSTFQDGTLYLTGTFRTLSMWWDPIMQTGSFQGIIDFDGGTHLGEVDPSIYQGWTFGGTTSSAFASIPQGYFQALDGQVFLATVPVEEATWGSVKSKFFMNE